MFVIWEDLIGEPEAKVVNFFTNYNDKYIVNLSELLAICLKNNKRSKMIVHLLLDNVVNVWESLAQFAVAQMMGADFGDEEDEEDEEDEDDDEPTPAKAKAHGHEHEHGENCNHDHDIDDGFRAGLFNFAAKVRCAEIAQTRAENCRLPLPRFPPVTAPPRRFPPEKILQECA